MTKRLIILIWEEGEPLQVEYDGEFDVWEVQAAFAEGLSIAEAAYEAAEEEEEQ